MIKVSARHLIAVAILSAMSLAAYVQYCDIAEPGLLWASGFTLGSAWGLLVHAFGGND